MRRSFAFLFFAALPAASGCNAVLGINPPSAEDWDGGPRYAPDPDSGADTPAPSDDGGTDASDAGVTDSGADAFVLSANPHAWADWPMPNPAVAALPNPQSYDASTTGVVTDAVTGLEWQHPASDMRSTLADATTLCQALATAGGGWRVPSRIELLSIVDYAQAMGPRIDATSFPNTVADSYWTSSVLADDPSSAWTVDFNGSTTLVHSSPTSMQYRVRCVRSPK